MKWRTIFILLGAALMLAFAKFKVLADCIGIVAFAWYAMLPFIDARAVRARWAKFTILFIGLFGMANQAVFLMFHSGWLAVSTHAKHILNSCMSFAGGIILGVTLTLMFSGQLFATRRDDKENSNSDTVKI